MQARQVAGTQRHGPAAGGAVGRVREANEALPLPVLEQLDDGREPALTRALRDLELVDEGGVAPRCCNLGCCDLGWSFGGHATNVPSKL